MTTYVVGATTQGPVVVGGWGVRGGRVPPGSSGLVCSGAGVCAGGRCIGCSPGTCGPACDPDPVVGAGAGACAALACPPGYYGADCARLCPGFTPETDVWEVAVAGDTQPIAPVPVPLPSPL